MDPFDIDNDVNWKEGFQAWATTISYSKYMALEEKHKTPPGPKTYPSPMEKEAVGWRSVYL